MNLQNSPIQKIIFRDKTFFIKRDDLLDRDFSGNKARKFYFFFKNEFSNIKRVISYGSNQSNAMYSISLLAEIKGWDFIYFVNHIPSYLKENPIGNYKYALLNGMKIIEDREKVEKLKENSLSLPKDTLFIPEGGHFREAEEGIKLLANEINSWAEENNIDNLKIFLPSGTGTTALYLQKYSNFLIYTTPCVGDSNYLKKEFFELEEEKYHPIILKPPKKYHFGKLYKEFFDIWKELKRETDIEFDLLYDPLGWITLLKYYQELKEENSTILLYIHQGGVLGNESMLNRYLYKYQL